MKYKNLTLLTDFYQLTMIQGYFFENMKDKIVVFDMFYRRNPSGNGFALCVGLEQIIDYIKNLKFTEEDIEYLSSLKIFNPEFLEYLKTFSFTGDIYAIPEGTVVFPQEPLIRVKAPIIEAQFIETALLNIINHQSLIATKAARIVYSTGNGRVLEFGLRRSQGSDAGIYGARAAIIGGCQATSNILSGKMFNIPVSGTHAHSWVMSFKDELSAFRSYANLYPDSCILLVDTYDTIKSGVPNAIAVFRELKESGVKLKNYGIRLDSGDLAYLSIKSRKMLDASGFSDAIISASSDLDEYLIRDLYSQGAKITMWGVGTNLITSGDCPSFGGVYKISAEINKNGEIINKIKLSENPEKVTNPGIKKIYRLYDNSSKKIKADLITLADEEIDENTNLTLFDPSAVWKKMFLKAKQFTARELLIPLFINGECVYKIPTVLEIKEYCQTELNSLWGEHRRLINPEILPVDLSLKLWNLKQDMIKEMRKE